MADANVKLQLNLKRGDDMLNIYGTTPDEFDGLVNYARTSENPELQKFFVKGSDTAQAAAKVAQAFPGSTVGQETPNCTVCGGSTKPKQITIKSGAQAGQQKTIFECLQQRGPCTNDRGYPNANWGSPKGRDA